MIIAYLLVLPPEGPLEDILRLFGADDNSTWDPGMTMQQAAASLLPSPAVLERNLSKFLARELPGRTTQVLSIANLQTTTTTTTARLGRAGVDYFELVVAWYCEDEKWFIDFEGPLAVYSKKLDCTSRLKKKLEKRPKESGPYIVKELPNVGREGHSYVKHILDNWDTLATYTAFTQGAGHHNGISAMAKVREFLAEGRTENHLLVPMVYKTKKGPLLYRDADKGDPHEKGGRDDDSNLHTFPYFSHIDMANRARELYISLFGGSACEAPPMIFIAGAQMIVHRDAIRAKPKAFWKHIYKSLADCIVYGWDFERLWVYAFDPKTLPAEKPILPGFCRGVNPWKQFDCKGYRKQEEPWQLPYVKN